MVDISKFGEQKWKGWIPPPKHQIRYDPNEEAPMWNWTRLIYNEPVDKGPIPWTKTGTQPKDPSHPDWRGVIRKNVEEYPIPEPYNYGSPNDPKYFWFDTPDYADPFKKLWYCAKFFFKTSLLAVGVLGYWEGRKFTIANNLNLTRRVVVPWVAAGLAGGATVITLANLRGKKDDCYNYFAAGFVMSLILWKKDHASWVRWVAVMPPLAAGVKYNAEINGHFWPAQMSVRTFRGSIGGLDAEHGWGSGDFRPSWYPRSGWTEQGRDTRRVY